MTASATKLKILSVVSLGIILVIAFSSSPTLAETRYVSDLLIISVREAPVNDAPTSGYLISDTPVELLEESEDGEFAKVESPEGLVGWVKKRYLNAKTPKSMIIQELEAQVKQLEDKVVLLQQNAATLDENASAKESETKLAALQTEINKKNQQVENLETELKQASAQYQKLLQQQDSDPDLKQEVAALKEQNNELARKLRSAKQNSAPSFFSGNMKWFFSGAGVLLLGLIVGRSLRRKSKYRY
jgi:SH3 domain protein